MNILMKIFGCISGIILVFFIGAMLLNSDANYLFGPVLDLYALPGSLIMLVVFVFSFIFYVIRLLLKAHKRATDPGD